jgi:hemerythrin-like metal-binding protein
MEIMEWLPEMTVGNAAIDAAHEALFDQMQFLLGAQDTDIVIGLLTLAERLERDFREEETLMEGIEFAGLRPHREEHARVLSALHHVDTGDPMAAREVLQLMVQWFPLHVMTMDAALVAALRRDVFATAPLGGAAAPSPEALRLLADTMPGDGPGD